MLRGRDVGPTHGRDDRMHIMWRKRQTSGAPLLLQRLCGQKDMRPKASSHLPQRFSLERR
ncbi:MAG: hypothetical protein D6740_09070 [Alphaproteobacteria bacterium]|nr:MAG: hypothetical protein D6740_09070 [Alphaproteobacteria bacterium]